MTLLKPLISTELALLLSLVMSTQAIDFSLPKVAYLTFVDRYTLHSFAFELRAIFAVSALHVPTRGGKTAALARAQSVLRWAFPASYVMAVLTVAALSFG